MTGRQRVHLTRLRLTDFRNWRDLEIGVDRRHVVLVGENGVGKTNMLEALSFLSPGRGFRRAAYDTIARIGGDGSWSVFAELQGVAGPVSIGTGIRQGTGGPEATRRIRINGAAARNGDELLDHLRLVWLVPAMDGLFSGPAADRRRFLDRLVLAIDPAHGRRVAAYEKSLRARARLLAEPFPDAGWLDAIEAQMAEAGTAIALARLELIALLNRFVVAAADPASPFPDAGLVLEGEMAALAASAAASELEEAVALRLREARRADAAAGRTLLGPHRCDLAVSHLPKSMPAVRCSTGEQKALLVGMLLAHAGLVAAMHGFPPILLLDEIAAHLDESRRAALFDRIDALDCQAWMTGTDRALFDSLGERATFWRIAGNEAAKE